jgi:hypothetical protein
MTWTITHFLPLFGTLPHPTMHPHVTLPGGQYRAAGQRTNMECLVGHMEYLWFRAPGDAL